MPQYMSRGEMSGERQTPKESTLALQYPMLSKDNYSVWSLKMRAFLKAQGLWEAIAEGDADSRKDQMALAAIYQAVPYGVVFC